MSTPHSLLSVLTTWRRWQSSFLDDHYLLATDGALACIFTVCILLMAWYRALTSWSLTAGGIFISPPLLWCLLAV